MELHRLQFNGAILERGFWLYAWEVKCDGRTIFYVGRTGDSSSQFASSPFTRMGQHLDSRPTATANMLHRQIRRLNLNPSECIFELRAFGPIYPEQIDLHSHRLIRDKIAPLEGALADYLREQGCEVVGKHGSKGALDPIILEKIKAAFSVQGYC